MHLKTLRDKTFITRITHPPTEWKNPIEEGVGNYEHRVSLRLTPDGARFTHPGGGPPKPDGGPGGNPGPGIPGGKPGGRKPGGGPCKPGGPRPKPPGGPSSKFREIFPMRFLT